MAGNEKTYVEDVFASNYIAPVGEQINLFEKELATYAGVKHCAVVSSGTAAIHLSLIMLGVGPGDIVLCQSFTFSASANPIKYQGASPVFIDSEPDTWNMDPELLEKALSELSAEGKKPKAIITVHLYGMPAKMKQIREIASRYNLPLIEDAAEALGASYEGQKCGSFGKLGVFSFNGNKIITTSGGGALVSDDEELIKKARFLSTQARDDAPHYQHSHIGYNYRMSNVCAAIGRGQLEILDKHVALRRSNYAFYRKLFSDIPGVSFVDEPAGSFANRWLTTILIDPDKTGGITRETLRLAFLDENIESRPLWKPMHMQPVFQSARAYTNGVSEALFDQGLCLPSGSNLTDHERTRIVEVIERVFVSGR